MGVTGQSSGQTLRQLAGGVASREAADTLSPRSAAAASALRRMGETASQTHPGSSGAEEAGQWAEGNVVGAAPAMMKVVDAAISSVVDGRSIPIMWKYSSILLAGGIESLDSSQHSWG